MNNSEVTMRKLFNFVFVLTTILSLSLFAKIGNCSEIACSTSSVVCNIEAIQVISDIASDVAINEIAKSTTTDAALQKAWESSAISSGTHILDNATGGWFYAVNTGESYAGISTILYKKSYFSGNLSELTGSKSLPAISINVHVNEIVTEQLPDVSKFMTSIIPNNTLATKAIIGFWGSRDFNNHLWLYGFYTGFQWKFAEYQ